MYAPISPVSKGTVVRRAVAAAVTLAAATAATATLAAPAQAKRGDIIRTGSCSGSADWKLKVSPEGSRVEIEAEVDSNRVGQQWTWTMQHNSVTVGSGTRKTAGASGSFTVRKLRTPAAGPDSYLFKAVRTATGEVCRATLSTS